MAIQYAQKWFKTSPKNAIKLTEFVHIAQMDSNKTRILSKEIERIRNIMAYMHIDDKIEPYLDILIDCIKLNGKDIEEQIKRITNETDLMGDCLEDNFLAFKLHSKKVRDEYEKAVDEEIKKSEKVWEKCDKLIFESRPKIEKAKNEMNGLLNEIEKIDKALDSVSIYKAEKLIELIEKFNNMPTDEKQLFAKLLEISKN